MPRSEHGGSTSTRSKRPLVRGGGVGDPDARRSPAPMRAAVRRSASARPGWRSTATSSPRPSISAARWVVLPPGAAQRSSTRSPGRGASSRATVIAARDWGMKRPACQSGESKASNGASSTRPSGRPSAGWVGTGSSAASAAASPRSVLTRSADSAGSLSAAISARASSGAERGEPQRGDPLGVRVAQRRLRGRRLGQRGDRRGGLARAAPQHGVDEPRARGRVRLDERDGLADRRVRGHAVEVGELVEPEPERGEHDRLEPVGRAPGERLDQVVERRAALDRAVGQPHGQRALARVEVEPARLAVQHAIGPRPVLEDAAQDGECADPRRGGCVAARRYDSTSSGRSTGLPCGIEQSSSRRPDTSSPGRKRPMDWLDRG